ncbi:ABC transporter substrate-binding protein [Pararhizobium mangrovi]|uniref:ABC transporter substrate-binding protein n=1 Tax=Pararhizobium mangrovi TaxID=2590452 RepID=A0A506TYN2_9HYPH|nr:ABC transporter substrate-binding protein [Pararhizobium mangrovi]TPW26318.1 ABC transporter substrate-binding protein [Pararhizobium mangrovi]
MISKRLAATCLGAAVAFACLPALPASAATLDIAMDTSPSGLDPHIVTSFASFQVIQGTIYEGLTRVDAKLAVEPSLAKSWKISDDGKTYTFDLRQDVKFHDGSAMTAKDVAASLKRVEDVDTGSPLASRISTVTSIETPDDHTVVLHLSEPTAPLLDALSSIAIVPAKYRKDTDTLQQTPEGTGPFKFVSWQQNVGIKLAANKNYWKKGEPKLDGVNFDIVPEAATRQVGLTSDKYQMLPNIDASAALQLKGRPNVKLDDTVELSYTLLGMNVDRKPLGNPKVREAINYAINRGDLVKGALFGAGVPAGPLSPALKNWAEPVSSFPCYSSNQDKARSLLKEAGVADGTQLTLLVLPRDDTRVMAQIIQQELSAVGITVKLESPEIGKFVQDWRNSNFDLFISANGGSADPDNYFYRTFHSGGSTNVFNYKNEQLDALLEKARTQTDLAARKKSYDTIQEMTACKGPVAFLTYAQLYTAMRSDVEGFTMRADRSLSSLADVTLK